MEKKNVEQVAQDIIRSLEDAGVVKPGNLQAVKLVLDMHLSKYQLITEETAPEVVAEKLGHVQLDTTKQCYAAISRETVRQAHNRYV